MTAYPLKWITERLAVGYAPRSNDDLSTIEAAGVHAIVNLCAECYDLHEAEKEFGFEVYFLPIADEAAPEMGDLQKLMDWLKRRCDAEKRVLVHCRYGIGRTGTVVLSYLIHSGLDFKTARKMLRHTPAWPATRAQADLVDRIIEERLGQTIASTPSNGRSDGQGRFFNRLRKALRWHDVP